MNKLLGKLRIHLPFSWPVLRYALSSALFFSSGQLGQSYCLLSMKQRHSQRDGRRSCNPYLSSPNGAVSSG